MNRDISDLVVAFSGPRDMWVSLDEVEKALILTVGRPAPTETPVPRRIIVGGATGIDTCVAEYCLDVLGVCPRVYPAWWKYYGKPAGPIRNLEMVQDCDVAIVLKDTHRTTAGTKSFYDLAHHAGKLEGVYFPDNYRIMDEEERKRHKAVVAKSYKEMKFKELRNG